MTRMRILLAALLLAVSAGVPAHVAAQARPAALPQEPGAQPGVVPPPAPQFPEIQVPPAELPDPDFGDFGRSRRAALRIGQDYRLRAGDEVRDVVMIAGNATIEGRVDQDVVVVLGAVRIGSTAVIEGELVVVGGGFEAPP